MAAPRVEIYLHNNSLCISKVDNEDDGKFLVVETEMDELKKLEPTDAAYKVGGTVLNLLRLWHTKEFKDWQVPTVPKIR